MAAFTPTYDDARRNASCWGFQTRPSALGKNTLRSVLSSKDGLLTKLSLLAALIVEKEIPHDILANSVERLACSSGLGSHDIYRPVHSASLSCWAGFLASASHVRRTGNQAASEQSPVSAYTITDPYTTKVMVAGDGDSTIELHFLDEGHPEHISLSDQFISKWEHKKPARGVEVLDIIKIEVRSAGIARQKIRRATCQGTCPAAHTHDFVPLCHELPQLKTQTKALRPVHTFGPIFLRWYPSLICTRMRVVPTEPLCTRFLPFVFVCMLCPTDLPAGAQRDPTEP